MEEVELIAQELTPETFAAFGDVIEVAGKPVMINEGTTERYHRLGDVEVGEGLAIMNIFRAQPRTMPMNVTMMERMPIVAALLEDGLARAKLSTEINDITDRMSLINSSSIENMNLATAPDVIYLDPMYPHREKSAAVKKEMRVFQSLVGEDLDADNLLAPAIALAKYRVVVKRPSYAPPLDGKKPSTSINMKKNRFDVYVNQAIPKKS